MGVTHGLELCRGGYWVLPCEEYFRMSLERMFAEGMEVFQKWMSESYKDTEKGTGGKTGLGRG